MKMLAPSDVIRAYFHAYQTKDRAAIEPLLADDFTFTSPLDDRINRQHYFERCWPNSADIASIRIEKLLAQGDEAFVQYELRQRGMVASWNTEFFLVRDGLIHHIDVYFGAAVEGIESIAHSTFNTDDEDEVKLSGCER